MLYWLYPRSASFFNRATTPDGSPMVLSYQCSARFQAVAAVSMPRRFSVSHRSTRQRSRRWSAIASEWQPEILCSLTSTGPRIRPRRRDRRSNKHH
ncbi:hypothetical protein K523DRAFT_321620, partial [Schizophyllum commune Tattone D]